MHIYIPAPSNGWCLNRRGLLNGTQKNSFTINLAPCKEGPGIYLYLEDRYLEAICPVF